jgi:hypothetical protein
MALLRGYARLGLSDGELALVLQIWTYWRDEALPCPAVTTLAAQLGKTERQVQQIVAGLRRRGLLTVQARHARERGQLSNAYDLSPLLRALEALPPLAAQTALGMVPVSGETMQDFAGGGVQSAAPNEDPGLRSLVLVSDPPTPRSKSELPEEFSEWLNCLSEQLGDAAPNSTQTRATRLLTSCDLDAGIFRSRFEQAARIAVEALPMVRRRGTAGAPNAMPYCFAVLEALLEGRPKPTLEAWPRMKRAVLVPQPSIPKDSVAPAAEAADQIDSHPLWPAVMASLAGTLAPSVFAQRVSPLRSRIGNDGALEIVALDDSMARWVEISLGRRVQEAIELAAPDPPAWRVVTCALEA